MEENIMSKIINSKTNEVIASNPNYYVCGVVEDFLSEHGCDTRTYDCLSDLVKTMTGDACTPFNTLAEMIQTMPEIVDCGEETSVFEVFGPTCDYWVLGWDYEGNEKLWTKILQKYFPDYVAIESED